ncbi:hypothetical protein GUITHDRAFT_109660 [Guillardia theta CCMP2712]|uniref:protein O-GlcNAc transferase n=1 Tax=Guillardia theta (strain CCMP2712) TaxID=905079 RepID=L1J8Z2_GUITC|nr:hypothetical protein GUITHDRAFT_109660 [Guillardia theta CCMP2712]EKX44545.1 hypothetical protein GUITHDRAFT_109660 [Guillardia theta CCMP2712]|eukprot:XP_005831525.1 hypothetical protein GUITHDRAFT_109660 [Guillardia theta CCMP2712]
MRAVGMELLVTLLLSFILAHPAASQTLSCTKKMKLRDIIATSDLLEASDSLGELVKCLKIAVAKDKTSSQLWRRLSSAVVRYDAVEALRLIEDGLAAVEQANAPGSVGLWAMKAEFLDKLGSDEQAEAAYKETRALLPQSDLTCYNLGFFYMTRNRYDEALAAFLEAAKLNPRSGRNAEAVGAVYFGNGMEEEALPWMRKAVELSPDEPNARMNLANALGKLEKSNEAVQAYMNVLRLDPTNEDAACKYAYFSIQNPPHAVHDGKYRKMFVDSSEALREINPLSDEEAAKMIRDDQIDILVDLMGYTHGAREGLLAMKPGRVQLGFKGYMSTTGGDFLSHLVSDAVSVPPELAVFYSEKQLQLGMLFSSSTHAINHPEMLSSSLISRKEAGLPDKMFIFACFNTLYKITPTLFLAWLKILKNVPKRFQIPSPFAVDSSQCPLVARRTGRREGTLMQLCTRKRRLKEEALVVMVVVVVVEEDEEEEEDEDSSKVPLEKHLQVKANADLFLDTPMYNAHSTAADALWAGVPVLTLAREKMAARVGASLALSLHMPELIVRNMEEYVSVATLLARRRRKLQRIREKLLRMRKDNKVLACAGGSDRR